MSSALDKTVARAEDFLKRFREKPVAHLIDGKQQSGSSTFETHSPIDNSVIAQVARGGAAEIDRAAKAATKAFRTGWSRTTGDERRRLLHKIADAVIVAPHQPRAHRDRLGDPAGDRRGMNLLDQALRRDLGFDVGRIFYDHMRHGFLRIWLNTWRPTLTAGPIFNMFFDQPTRRVKAT